MIQSV